MFVRGGALARVVVLLVGTVALAPAAVAVAAPPVPRADPPVSAVARSDKAGQAAVALPANVTASSLAARVTTLVTDQSRLEARATELDRQLTAASAKAGALEASTSVETREASSLLAAARRQAVAAYVGGDPAQQSFALISAAGQGNVNDVTWSIGLLRSSSQRTLSLARAARSKLRFADASLTDALAERDRIADERARMDLSIAAARKAVLDAEADLEAYVKRLGPGTIVGMTTVAYDAYKHAEAQVAAEQKACGLRWELLAAIGKTESNHGMGRLDSTGLTTPPILGIPIGPDTDKGVIDTDPALDHAIGPMQFIPSTWKRWGADGNADGIIDVNNIYDEALAAGRYLCAAAGADTLATREGVIKAIWAYNPNEDYLRTVGGRYESLASDVAAGWFSSADLPTPNGPGTLRPVTGPGDDVPEQPAASVRPIRPFSATALVAPAVAAGERPAVCGPSARMPGRAGIVRCDLPAVAADPAANPPVAAQPPASYDPCVAAPYDGQLAACMTDPEQPVQLVRAAAPIGGPLAEGLPFFGLVLEGGDRCVATGPAPATAAAPGKARVPSAVRAGVGTPAGAGAAPGDVAVAAAGTTTTAAGTTTTTRAATTTTTAPAATTTSTTRPATTTTIGRVAPTTVASGTTTSTVAPSTTTTTLVTPGATLPPAPAPGAGTTFRYTCASGAVVVGHPTPGTVAPPAGAGAGTAPATVPASTTTSTTARGATTTTTVAGQPAAGPWVAQVVQPGIAPRQVAVITLLS